MGLFCDVLHVWQRDRDQVLSTFSTILAKSDYAATTAAISPPHPDALKDELLYFVAPRSGNWTVIIQAHSSRRNSPQLAELADALSSNLKTVAFSLNVHDDDILFYNLYGGGEAIDGYNSAPLYFENGPLPEDQLTSQRHDPRVFTPLMPAGTTVEQLKTILDRGWWAAHDGHRLNESGLPPRDESGFVFEHERMIAVGDLLQLHGSASGYPYATWYRSPKIQWTSLVALHAQRKPSN